MFFSFIHKANPFGRIVNGDKAAKYQFPWHVSIQNNKTNSEKSYCGGSLIAPQFVLTAASCLKNVSTIQIDIGSIEFWNPNVTLQTNQYQIYPEYNEEFKTHNIAVIRLPTIVEYNTNIRSILLPRISDVNETYESIEAYVSGFGVFEAGSSYLSGELRFARQTVISNDVCRQSFDSRLITNSALCGIGYNGSRQSTCYGDQGGAFASHIDGAWVQIGLSSFIHPSGCTGEAPAGYTKIAPYLEWINRLTGVPIRQ